jgi:hypothetical protein
MEEAATVARVAARTISRDELLRAPEGPEPEREPEIDVISTPTRAQRGVETPPPRASTEFYEAYPEVLNGDDPCSSKYVTRHHASPEYRTRSIGPRAKKHSPLGQDGRPSTCNISGLRRPPGTIATPNRTVSSVSVGWWRS